MSLSGELKELFDLYKLGALSEDEFKQAKAKLLGGSGSGERGADSCTATSSSTSPAVTMTNSAVPLAASDTEPVPPSPLSQSIPTSMPPLHPTIAEEITSRFTHLRTTVTVLVQLQLREHSASAHNIRRKAYEHLYTIFENLVRDPVNARFRRLRLSNSVLSKELWPVPGCVLLLQAAGFAATEEDASACMATDSAVPMPTAVTSSFLTLGSAMSRTSVVDCAQEGLSAVVFCRKEMEEQRKRQQVSRGLITCNVTLEIRLENARAAVAKGELSSFLATLFTRDDAGDDLLSVREHLREIESLFSTWTVSVREGSASAGGATRTADVAIDLDDPRWYRAVLRQRGALELLLVGAHGALRERSVGVDATGQVSLPTSTTPTSAVTGADVKEKPLESDARDTTAQIVLSVHDAQSVEWCTQATELLRGVIVAVEGARARRQREAQAEAQAAAAVLMRRERKRLDHERDRAAERSAETGVGSRRRLSPGHGTEANRTAAASSDDSDTDEENEAGTHERRSKANASDATAGEKRVPLATALSFLMGKEVDEWDPDGHARRGQGSRQAAQ